MNAVDFHNSMMWNTKYIENFNKKYIYRLNATCRSPSRKGEFKDVRDMHLGRESNYSRLQKRLVQHRATRCMHHGANPLCALGVVVVAQRQPRLQLHTGCCCC